MPHEYANDMDICVNAAEFGDGSRQIGSSSVTRIDGAEIGRGKTRMNADKRFQYPLLGSLGVKTQEGIRFPQVKGRFQSPNGDCFDSYLILSSRMSNSSVKFQSPSGDCFDSYAVGKDLEMMGGSPPRVWGKRDIAGSKVPGCAVHPHACGENSARPPK